MISTSVNSRMPYGTYTYYTTISKYKEKLIMKEGIGGQPVAIRPAA